MRTTMYANFAKEAREEGFEHIAKLFEGVAEIENQEQRYNDLLENIKTGKYSSKKPKWYGSRNCGNRVYAKEAPKFAMCALIPKRILKRT